MAYVYERLKDVGSRRGSEIIPYKLAKNNSYTILVVLIIVPESGGDELNI